MFKKKKVFALIPAKGNSKRLKNKNLKKINNKSLLEIAINSAKKSKYIDHIFISTDSKKIIDISSKLQCGIIKRPSILCGEKSLSNDVIYHSIKQITKNYKLSNFIIILLHVTSPLRTYRDINSSFRLMKTKASKGILTVKKVNSSLLKSVLIKKNKITSINEERYLTSNDQFLPELYALNGSIYIFQSRDFLINKSIPFKKMFPHVMRSEKSIDINNISDLNVARKLFNKQNLKF